MAAFHRMSFNLPDDVYRQLKEDEARRGVGTMQNTVIVALQNHYAARFGVTAPAKGEWQASENLI